MRKLAVVAVLLAMAGGLAFWFLTAPNRLPNQRLAAFGEGDAARGEQVFWAGGCTSCHAAPGATGDAKLSLSGGLELTTDFGTFVAPNISSDTSDGIGAWSVADFANAMMAGVSPDGAHYYPAFPYTSYTRMSDQDVADLFAFMKTLPAVSGAAPDHKIGFPFNIRRAMGGWKLLFMRSGQAVTLAEATQQVERGQYLVEGPGHCGECHTSRNLVGGIDYSNWLAGAPAAEGEGFVPNITSGEGGLGNWSAADIAYYLESGFTPEFDSVGGAMVAVQQNMAKLSKDDRDAIAAYLKAVPARAENR